ncbi:MAG: hypothetical protein AAF514_12600 [Verrucomicrobiota bacterium]
MKPLTLFLCLFFIGCEKRAADPELDFAREWLRSEEAEKQLVSFLDKVVEDGRFLTPQEVFDEFEPRQEWAIRRVFVKPASKKLTSHTGLLMFVVEKENKERGWILRMHVRGGEPPRVYLSGDLAWANRNEYEDAGESDFWGGGELVFHDYTSDELKNLVSEALERNSKW